MGGIGGGIHNNPGMIAESALWVINSTISGNSAGTEGTLRPSRGGGLNSQGITFLFNVTVFGNYAGGSQSSEPVGAGIHSEDLYVALFNSIVAGNRGPDGTAMDCGGRLILHYSLVGSTEGCFPDTGAEGAMDELAVLNVDPRLGPLQDNGGSTPTHALLPGSPAIDAGDPEGCKRYFQGELFPVDQRGATRPEDGDGDGRAICDLGAFEAPKLQPPPVRHVFLPLVRR
jgi:hypothetical protein